MGGGKFANLVAPTGKGTQAGMGQGWAPSAPLWLQGQCGSSCNTAHTGHPGGTGRHGAAPQAWGRHRCRTRGRLWFGQGTMFYRTQICTNLGSEIRLHPVHGSTGKEHLQRAPSAFSKGQLGLLQWEISG